MSTAEHFRLLGRYNAWANGRLYAAAAGLEDADLRRDGGAFFGSLSGTLNHILVADQMWLRRITGEGPLPDRPDAVLHADFDGLRAARRSADERILRLVDGLDDRSLAADPAHLTWRGEECLTPLWLALTHMFNHQTHHRGQAHTLLTQSYAEAPDLDLICFVREASTAAEPAGQPTWSHFRQPASVSTASSAGLAFSR